MTDPLAARLEALASVGKTSTYGALARDLGLSVAQVTARLEAMMDEDFASGRPFRAALCEGRLSGGMPARGFFDKAAALGRDLSDPAKLVATDRAALFAAARATTP